MLERNLAWIATADVKVGVIVAIDTGMLGGLCAAFSASNAKMQTSLGCVVHGDSNNSARARANYRRQGDISAYTGAYEIIGVLRTD